MTAWTLQLGYALHYGATVSVEAGTVEEACRLAIEEADETEAWRSTDHVSDSCVLAIVEGRDGKPWEHPVSPIPVPDEYSEHGPPPVLTLFADTPPGAMRLEGGALRIRFETPDRAVETELTDPPPPPGNKPTVTVSRRADGTPDISVRGGRARIVVTGWDTP